MWYTPFVIEQPKIGIYLRISQDPNQTGLAIDRQRDEIAALFEQRRWPPAVYEFTDTASATRKKPRPGWDGLMAAIEAGEIDMVVVTEVSRAWRSMRELEIALTAFESFKISVVAARAGDLDLTTASGRLVVRMLTAVAQAETDVKVERQVAESFQRARAGRQKSGGPRGWGFERDMTINEPEAAVVREVTRRVLGGERVGSLARELGERGIATPTGRAWDAAALRRSLLRPSLAGFSVYRGAVVAGGEWAPILTPKEHAALKVRLATGGKRWGRQSPLTGLVWCGRCGASMAQATVGNRRVMRCYNTPTRPGCHLQVNADVLEDLLVGAARAALAGAVAPAPAEPTSGVDLMALAARRDEAALAFSRGNLSMAEWSIVRADIEQQESALVKQAGATADLGTLVAEAWETASIDQRRAVLSALIERVEVAPAKWRGPAQVRDVWQRLTIAWRV
jgi:DNA invertase Pin-like site-specific DNA recombinase